MTNNRNQAQYRQSSGDIQEATYRMRSVIRAREVHHAINAGKRCASTLAPMRIEFLLGQNIATALETKANIVSVIP